MEFVLENLNVILVVGIPFVLIMVGLITFRIKYGQVQMSHNAEVKFAGGLKLFFYALILGAMTLILYLAMERI